MQPAHLLSQPGARATVNFKGLRLLRAPLSAAGILRGEIIDRSLASKLSQHQRLFALLKLHELDTRLSHRDANSTEFMVGSHRLHWQKTICELSSSEKGILERLQSSPEIKQQLQLWWEFAVVEAARTSDDAVTGGGLLRETYVRLHLLMAKALLPNFSPQVRSVAHVA